MFCKIFLIMRHEGLIEDELFSYISLDKGYKDSLLLLTIKTWPKTSSQDSEDNNYPFIPITLK